MKKFLFLFIYLGFYFMGHQGTAQISQGSHSAGLEIGWGDRQIDENDERFSQLNNFRFSPTYSYFIKDQLSIIGGGSYHQRKRRFTFPNTNPIIGPAMVVNKELDVFMGLRKYIEVRPKLFLIGTYGIRYFYTNYLTEPVISGDDALASTRLTANQFGLFGNLGLAYFPSEKFSFELIFIEGQFFRVYNKHFQNHQTNTYYQDNGWGLEVDGFLDHPSLAVRYYF